MEWDSSLYDRRHAFVFKYGEDVLALLDAQAGERILDVGCGTGHLTSAIAETGAEVTGIDSSAEMIATARAAYPNINFIVADASDFHFDETFDAVFSNAALHWVARAEQAVICMSRALKPGGRFVAEFGGKGNIVRIARATERAILEIAGVVVNADNYFPSIGEYAALLEKHGLQVATAALFDRMTKLEEDESGLRNWLMMFRRSLFNDLSDDVKQRIFERVEDQLRESLFIDGCWHADYRRLRITAYKDRINRY